MSKRGPEEVVGESVKVRCVQYPDPRGGWYRVGTQRCANYDVYTDEGVRRCQGFCWVRTSGEFAGRFCCFECSMSEGQRHDGNCTSVIQVKGGKQ